MKFQKGFVIPLIIAITAILAIGGVVFVTQKKEAKAPVVTEYFPIKELGIEIPLSADIQDLTYEYNSDSKSVSFSSKSLQGKGGDCSTDIGSLGYIFIRNTATTTIVADNEVSAMKTVGDRNIYYFQSQNPCSVDKKVLDYAYSQIIILKSALNNAGLIKAVDTPIVGGDKDTHGCIGSAGYSWCAVKNKCLRVWEERCEVVATSTNPVACTMDAMMCPDGTYVGRSAPDCKFICPAADPANVKINQKVLVNGLTIIPLKVTEDSRCPMTSGIQCVWVGTVRLDTQINGATTSLRLDFPTSILGKEVTLIKVLSVKTTANIPQLDYSFEFSVK